MTAGDTALAAALDCLGVPFRHQGRDPRTGLDCGGLVVHAMCAAGAPVADVFGYARMPSGGMLDRVMSEQPALTRVPVRTARPGDILLVRFGNETAHLAIKSRCGMVHAYERAGRVVEHAIRGPWVGWISRAYRIEG